jgi:hypothetical protein
MQPENSERHSSSTSIINAIFGIVCVSNSKQKKKKKKIRKTTVSLKVALDDAARRNCR